MSYELDAKKFAWAILIKDGVPFAEWEYYANGYLTSLPKEVEKALFGGKDVSKWSNEYAEAARKLAQSKLKEGVDWEKTGEPVEDTQYGFGGTEYPSNRVSCLKGTLVLKDGTEIPYGAEVGNDDPSFMEMAKRAMKAQDLIKEVFGDE